MLNIDSHIIIFHINPYDAHRELLFRIIVRVLFLFVLYGGLFHIFWRTSKCYWSQQRLWRLLL